MGYSERLLSAMSLCGFYSRRRVRPLSPFWSIEPQKAIDTYVRRLLIRFYVLFFYGSWLVLCLVQLWYCFRVPVLRVTFG
jgi:hypothetical protein